MKVPCLGWLNTKTPDKNLFSAPKICRPKPRGDTNAARNKKPPWPWTENGNRDPPGGVQDGGSCWVSRLPPTCMKVSYQCDLIISMEPWMYIWSR